jgi:hypothetical protein
VTGWLKLHRKLISSKIWDANPHLLKLWIWCLIKAEWLEGTAGRITASERTAAKECGITRKQVRIGIATLERMEMISTHRAPRRSTQWQIVKWEQYQSKEGPSPSPVVPRARGESRAQMGQKGTSLGPSLGTSLGPSPSPVIPRARAKSGPSLGPSLGTSLGPILKEVKEGKEIKNYNTQSNDLKKYLNHAPKWKDFEKAVAEQTMLIREGRFEKEGEAWQERHATILEWYHEQQKN